jgi:hypothetical protein
MFRVTQNIIAGKGLSVSREEIIFPAQNNPIFQPSHDEIFWTTSAVPGRDGKTYSKYGIGQSLIAIPLHLMGDLWESLFIWEEQFLPEDWYPRLFVSMLNPIALAGIVWLMVSFGRALGYQIHTSRWIAIAFVFTSMAWPYVKTFYPQPSVALLLLLAVYAAYQWRKAQEIKWLWWLSLALGLAILFRFSALIIVPVIIIYLVFTSSKQERWRWILPLVIGVGGAGLVTAWYNWQRFGSVFETGYHEVAWTNPTVYGLYGLIYSPGKGILFYAPMLILCLVGFILFARVNKPELWLILGLWISYLAFYAPYDFWTGGFNWGPRFLLPVLPLAFLTLGTILEDQTIRGGKFLFTIFFILGLMIQIPAIIVDHSRYLNQQFENSDDISQAYGETINNIEYSPILQQWPIALDLLAAYSHSDTWESARQHLRSLGSVPSNVHNGQALLYSEFFRRNTLDFWWMNIFFLPTNESN